MSNPYVGINLDQHLEQIVSSQISPLASKQRLTKLAASSAWRVDAPKAGPSVTIFGGIHGNEPCGVFAICELLSLFASGGLGLKRGSVTLIVANEEALKADQRFIEHDMNRLFLDRSGASGHYEADRVEQLKPFLRKSAYHLDLHSATQPTVPFVWLEHDSLAEAFGISVQYVLTARKELTQKAVPGTSQSYASMYGARSLTVESGQHYETSAGEHAVESSLRFLNLCEVVEQADSDLSGVPKVLEVTHIQAKRCDKFEYSRPFSSFDPLSEGEVIGRDSHGQHTADDDGYIVFPIAAELQDDGKELYMLARERSES